MKRTDPSMKTASKKRLALLLSMILIFTCVVGGTLAYLFAKTDSITDTFEPAQVSCTVDDAFSTVTNESETSVWLRVSITAVFRSTTDSSAVHWQSPTLTVDLGENWQLVDGFYYYKTSIDAGGIVNLPAFEASGSVDGFEIEKQVLAEVIQSAPLDAVQSSWKVTINGTTWETYSANP